MDEPQRTTSRLAARAAAAALAAATATIPAIAQQPQTPPPADPPTLADPVVNARLAAIDGRTFAGVELPIAPAPHRLDLAATRATAWQTLPTGVEGLAAGTPTERLLLDGDVRITVGPYSFAADRAVVWIEPVRFRADDTTDPVDAQQVAIYMLRARPGPTSVAPRATPMTPRRTQNDAASNPALESARLSADRLLVTAILTDTDSALRADQLLRGRPRFGDDATFVEQANQRLARHLRAIVIDAADRPAARRIEPRPLPSDPDESGFDFADESFVDTRTNIPEPEPRPIRRATRGNIAFRAADIALVEAPDQSATTESPADTGDPEGPSLVLTAGVSLEFRPTDRDGAVRLDAQNAVVFLSPGTELGLGSARLDSGDVRGIYLEGGVSVLTVLGDPARVDIATDTYHLRGSRVYYDPQTEEAVILDAVFWTYDAERGMPLYVRAEEVRQRSTSQWSAERATLANVAFAEPHFSVGASSITVTREERPGGRSARPVVSAEGVSFRVGDVPVFGVPRLEGEFRPAPIRSLTVESEGGDPVVRTEWDLYALLGIDTDAPSEATLLIDGYDSRGVGIGTRASVTTDRLDGEFFGYYIRDNGTDRLTTGARLDRNDEDRGVLLGEGVWRADELWTLYGEFSKVSDPAFVDAFLDGEEQTRREFITAGRATRRSGGDNDSLLTLEVAATFDEFIVNEYLLQSRGYQVERLPELTWQHIGVRPLGLPILYSQESSLGSLRIAPAENDLRTQGFDTQRRVTDAFGPAFTPGTSFDDVFEGAGVPTDSVLRFDTRHEASVDLSVGEIDVQPYAVGRFTAWDEDFRSFDPDGEAADDRVFGSVGLRAATAFYTVDETVESETFDLDRLRHIIEPNLHVWHASANTDQSRLPVYDEDVESLATGTAVRFGVRNTWQTKRGAPGRERSVDWLTVDTDFVWAGEATDRESPILRFFDDRPENSYLGSDFAETTAVLRLTEAVSLTGEGQYDTEEGTVPFTTTGVLLDHGYGYSSYVEYRTLDEPDLELVAAGARYELTRKYALRAEAGYSPGEGNVQSLGARFERRFPQWTLAFGFDFDDTEDFVSFGMTVRPVGFGGEDRVRVLTQEFPLTAAAPTEVRFPDSRFEGGPFVD